MTIAMLIIGILLTVAALGFLAHMLWITPRHQAFSSKAMMRYVIFGAIGAIGGIALIVFSFLI